MVRDARPELLVVHLVQVSARRLAGHVAERVERVWRVDVHVGGVALPAVAQRVHHRHRTGERLGQSVGAGVDLRDAGHELQPEGVRAARVEQRVLDVHPVLRRLHVVALHVAEHEAASAQQMLERPQAHVVEVRVDAAEVMQVQVAHGVHAVDVLPERAVALQEPGVVLAHEALVVLVAPQHVRPVREAVAPRVRPVREARRQARSLPALVNDAHRVLAGVPLDVQQLAVVQNEGGSR